MNRYLILLILFLPILVIAVPEDPKAEPGHSSEMELLLRMAREAIPEQLDKANSYAVRALELARQSKSPELEVASLLIQAEIALERGDYIGSFTNYQKAVEIAEENLLDTCIVDSYLGMAKFYVKIEEVEEANNFLMKALEKSIQIDDNYRMGLVQFELSYSYRQLNDYDLSNMYAEKAVEVFKTEKDDYNLATSYILLAKNYLDLGDYDKAYEIDNRVLEITEDNSDHRNRGLAFNDLAWNYFQQGDMKKALEYNMKALSTRKKFGYKVLEASSLINIAVLFMEWERYDDAYDFFSRAERVFQDKNSYAMEKMKLGYFEKVSELDELTGNLEGALENYHKFHKLDNELERISDNKTLNKIRTQFEIKRFSKEKSDLNKLQQIEIKRQRVALIAILIITVLTIASIFFLYSRYRLKKKLNDELSRTNNMLQKVNEKTGREIAEKKRMEKIINANAEHLKLINRILRHDITNDLVTIKSGLSVFKAKKDEAILEELSRRIAKSVNLIHSMRDFEEFMNQHINLKVIDPVAVINDIADNYKNIKINLTGDCKVMAEDSFNSALENIIRNAIEHGGVDEIDIIIEESENRCHITVADQGSGMPDRIKDKIFQEGFHYGSSGNTGMGLFIARKAIESFGGNLFVEDNEPQGSKFIITLRKAI